MVEPVINYEDCTSATTAIRSFTLANKTSWPIDPVPIILDLWVNATLGKFELTEEDKSICTSRLWTAFSPCLLEEHRPK